MSCSHHGGGCCGVFHVHDFPSDFHGHASGMNQKKWLKTAVEAGREKQHGHYYEGPCDCGEDGCSYEGDYVDSVDAVYAVDVVLADYQMDMWEETLTAAGFKMVLSFENTNSGNTCYIFLGLTTELKL